MGFHIEIRAIPRMVTYDQARARFNSIKPIRGGSKSIRRLAERGDASKWIKEEIRDGIEVYVAGYYRADVVTYYPTHYEVSMGGYNTTSTRLFIWAALGVNVSTIYVGDWVPKWFKVPFPWVITYNDYPMESTGYYKFYYQSHEPVKEIEKPTKYKINRKRMNDVRAPLKPFYTYIDAMAAIMPDGIAAEPVKYWESPHWNNVDSVLANIENEKAWWDLFTILSWQTHRREWYRAAGNGSYSVNTPTAVRDVKAMKKWIEKGLKSINPQVLDVVN